MRKEEEKRKEQEIGFGIEDWGWGGGIEEEEWGMYVLSSRNVKSVAEGLCQGF